MHPSSTRAGYISVRGHPSLHCLAYLDVVVMPIQVQGDAELRQPRPQEGHVSAVIRRGLQAGKQVPNFHNARGVMNGAVSTPP